MKRKVSVQQCPGRMLEIMHLWTTGEQSLQEDPSWHAAIQDGSELWVSEKETAAVTL